MWNPNSLPTHWQLTLLRFNGPQGCELECLCVCVCVFVWSGSTIKMVVHATVTWAPTHMAQEEGRNNGGHAQQTPGHIQVRGHRSQKVVVLFPLHVKSYQHDLRWPMERAQNCFRYQQIKKKQKKNTFQPTQCFRRWGAINTHTCQRYLQSPRTL